MKDYLMPIYMTIWAGTTAIMAVAFCFFIVPKQGFDNALEIALTIASINIFSGGFFMYNLGVAEKMHRLRRRKENNCQPQ